MDFYKDKKVLVTGGTGLIGQPLVSMLCEAGADVKVVSLDDPSRAPKDIDFVKADLRELSNCEDVCRGQDIVFHLAGVKGSPKMTAEKPASFLVPTVTFSFNMMEAARRQNVDRFLFTSSVGVYSPAELFCEDDVWKTFPSPNDKFAGWAKRLCELQAEAYQIEHKWNGISIVRPANVFGPFDNFDPNNAMVIPSLIHRALSGESPLRVWGDGSPVRDFIFSSDVARGMMLAVEKGISEPLNLGSGVGVSIKEIVETLVELLGDDREIIWDTSKPSGDAKRLMDTTRAEKYGFRPVKSLKDGMSETINWYIEHAGAELDTRYNSFTEK